KHIIFSRFQFTNEEIQAFREEHEQRNGDLTKPEEDSSSSNTRQASSLKRAIDLRWSVNLKEPLLSHAINKDRSNEAISNPTPASVLREIQNQENSKSNPFAYRL
ncbi:unnamed protein product, partial [Rotaria socialis]